LKPLPQLVLEKCDTQDFDCLVKIVPCTSFSNTELPKNFKIGI